MKTTPACKPTWKLWERILCAVCASVLLIWLIDLTVPAKEAKIYDAVIRLHVLANSDSEEDQSVKLLVRDAILAECGELFDGVSETEDALSRIGRASEQMEQIADRVLEENGFPYRAKAVFGVEAYPTRSYDGVDFPAGEYRSLRILLGEGAGQNWWCCLFPPLCMSASSAKESLDGVGIDSSSGKVFTKKTYRFRFKLLEFFFRKR